MTNSRGYCSFRYSFLHTHKTNIKFLTHSAVDTLALSSFNRTNYAISKFSVLTFHGYPIPKFICQLHTRNYLCLFRGINTKPPHIWWHIRKAVRVLVKVPLFRRQIIDFSYIIISNAQKSLGSWAVAPIWPTGVWRENIIGTLYVTRVWIRERMWPLLTCCTACSNLAK